MATLIIILSVGALLLKSEIFTMFVITFAVVVFAGSLIRTAAEHEPKKLDGSFSTEWGKK